VLLAACGGSGAEAHPLDPLSGEVIATAVSALREAGRATRPRGGPLSSHGSGAQSTKASSICANARSSVGAG
jgi:hypothetical protein